MIFKTFDSDIDNMSSRWGMFGKSFSDIGDTITTKWKQIANAEEVVTTELIRKQAELEAQKYYTANATNELKNATLDEYVEFLNEADISDTAKQALARLELQKIAVNNVQIETSGDIERIYALAEAAGASAIQLAKLADAKAIIEKYNTVGLNGTVADLKKYEEAQAIIKSIEEGTYKVDLDFRLDYKGGSSTKKATESAKKSAKEAETALKDYIEAYLNFQEKSLDAGKINFKTYSDNVANFLKNMFDQGKISAKDYYDYTEKMLNKQQSVYQSALKGITSILDKEIDSWEKKIDAINDKLDELNQIKDNYDSILSAVDDVYQSGKFIVSDGSNVDWHTLSADDIKTALGYTPGTGSNIVTAVKGDAEEEYKTGNVNISPSSIGLGNVDNTHDNEKAVLSASKLSTSRKIGNASFNGTADVTLEDIGTVGIVISAIKPTNQNAGDFWIKMI